MDFEDIKDFFYGLGGYISSNGVVIKFIFLFILLVILPVWIFAVMPMGIKWKLAFTLGGAIGLVIALSGKTMRLHR